MQPSSDHHARHLPDLLERAGAHQGEAAAVHGSPRAAERGSMTKPRFAFHRDALAAGWFSRRHETPDANREARQAHRDGHSVEARRERAYARGAERPKERT